MLISGLIVTIALVADEVTRLSRQRCRACAIFRPTGGYADSENQRQVIEDRALRDKRHIRSQELVGRIAAATLPPATRR